jgi:hypothetical protein
MFVFVANVGRYNAVSKFLQGLQRFGRLLGNDIRINRLISKLLQTLQRFVEGRKRL